MNTSKPNPHIITPTTVMESDFDEPTPHRKPGKSTGRPRSRHKHMYTLGWASYTFASHLTGKTFTRYLPVNYCTICGRLGGVSVSQFTGQEPKVPPIGSKVFVVPSFGTNALDLNNFIIFKGE